MDNPKIKKIKPILLCFILLIPSISGCLEEHRYIKISVGGQFNTWKMWQEVVNKLKINSSYSRFNDFSAAFCNEKLTLLYLSFTTIDGKKIYTYRVYLAKKISPQKYLLTYDRYEDKNYPYITNISAKEIFKRIGIWNISDYIEKAGLNRDSCEVEIYIETNIGISEEGNLMAFKLFKRVRDGYVETNGTLIDAQGEACMRLTLYNSPIAYYEIL